MTKRDMLSIALKIVGVLAVIYFFCIPLYAQLFCVDQLVNPSHAETWNIYLGPKSYISFYYDSVWRPQHQDEDVREFFKHPVPMPESLFAHGFYVKVGDLVAVFQNSMLQTIDRITGFWGLSTEVNSHMYIGLEKYGLRDALGRKYANLYIIDTTQVTLEGYRGVDLEMQTSSEYDSILSCAVDYLIGHRALISDIWDNADTSISSSCLRQSIQDSFNISVLAADFTGDHYDDFVLETAQISPGAWKGMTFTFVFESDAITPHFIRWSKFEQIIQTEDGFNVMVEYWKPHTGIRGWAIYEKTEEGTLELIFSAGDYST